MIESFNFFKRKRNINLTDIVDTVFYSLIDLMDDGYEVNFNLNFQKVDFPFNYINNKLVFKDRYSQRANKFYTDLISEYSYFFDKKDELIVIIRKVGTFKFSDVEDVISETIDRIKEMGLSTSWDIIKGINKYDITVTDQNGITYNYLGNEFNNTYATSKITNSQNTTNYIFNGISGMTYSITVTGINAAGSTSSTVNVLT